MLHEKITTGQVLRAEPITITEETFTTAKTTITARNFLPYPMDLQVNIHPPDGIAVEPRHIKSKVLPSLSKSFEVKFSAQQSIQPPTHPVKVTATIGYTFPGKEPLTTPVPAKIDFKPAEQLTPADK
jgi:hypothetical protein